MQLDDFEAENGDLKEHIQAPKDERDEALALAKDALATAKDCKAQAVGNEQHSRKSSVRVFCLNEQDDEDSMEIVLDLLKEKLGLSFTRKNLSTAHRVGAKKVDRPRAILVAFYGLKIAKAAYVFEKS